MPLRTSASTAEDIMRSPWHVEQQVSREEHREQQMMLGHFMERSTSAPPISTEHHKFGGDNLMNDSDFLFGNSDNHHGDAGLFSESGRDSAPLQSSSYVFSGALEDNTGRSTAPLSYATRGSSLSDALLSSGLSGGQSTSRATTARSTSLGFGHHVDQHSHSDTKPTADESHFVRSRSAAPSFLNDTSRVGPPPGLSPAGGSGGGSHLLEMNSRDQYCGGDSYSQIGMRRATSAGPSLSDRDSSSSVLASLGLMSNDGRGGAVRPAPKTLMDLIKEDSPPPYNHKEPFPSYNTTNMDRLAAPPRPQAAGPFYDRSDFGYNERASTAASLDAFPNDPGEHPPSDGYHHQRLSRGYQSSAPQGIGGISQKMERLQVGQGGQHYGDGQTHKRVDHAPTNQYITVPVSQGQRGVSPMAHHQEPLFQDHGRPQPRPIYSQTQLAPHQQPSHQFDGQQVYYTSNQKVAPLGLDQTSSFTTAVLPNGQTVYLNASQFSYAAVQPVQYQAVPHQPHQQSHIIHAQSQLQGQEYMSIVPMQPSGHVAYYQGLDGSVRSQPLILNQQVPGPPRAVESAPIHGRMKEADRMKTSTKGRRGGSGASGGRRDDPRGKHTASSSPLLDEFRTTKNRDWTMLDITGHVVEFCQDQNGSRFIQQRLEIGNTSEQQVVMAEVLPAVRQLRNDVFGNYVVQKLLEFGTHQMKAQLRDTLKGEMLPLSLQMYGCRVVQKALETLDEDDLPKLLIEFHHNVLSCIHDQNGNHVIQKCIEVMSTKAKQAYATHDGERARFFGEQIDFIMDDVLENVTPLSCHPYGCRVLQRILEHCIEPKKILALDEIAKCHRVLLDDQYGNYVIQHVLQYGRHQDRESIMHIVIANGILPLSKQKFASNVVEKLLKYGTPTQRNLLVREMLAVVDDPNTGGSSVVLLMVRDAYANYVVQTTLDVISEGEEKRLLLEELNAHSAQLRQYTFAKHIVTKLSS